MDPTRTNIREVTVRLSKEERAALDRWATAQVKLWPPRRGSLFRPGGELKVSTALRAAAMTTIQKETP